MRSTKQTNPTLFNCRFCNKQFQESKIGLFFKTLHEVSHDPTVINNGSN